jgi:phosphatidylserine/phosphatidylglycerophosphate/cardiolipin synthase-like enzyme
MTPCTLQSQAEVFVGTGAGSPLYHDLKEAARSVRVVTPYLGEHLAEVLLGCQERGVDVKTVVSDDGWNTQDLARLLVVQTARVVPFRQKLARYGSAIAACSVLAAAVLLGGATLDGSVGRLVAAVPLGVLGGLFWLHCRQLGIYRYAYRYRLEELRVAPSPRSLPHEPGRSATPFVHAKIYVIDDRVAYLGSANLTTAGLFDNLEAMARLTSPDAVAALGRCIDELVAGGQLPAYPPEAWARRFFREPRAVRARRAEPARALAPSPVSS